MPGRHLACAALGRSLALVARRLSILSDLLATPARLDRVGRVDQAATAPVAATARRPTHRLETRRDRQRLGTGAFWGVHTGPNPVDRAKNGCKRHIIVDAQGTPLAIHTTPANLRDDRAALATLKRLPAVTDATGVVLRPQILQGDRGYGFVALIAAIAALLIKPLLALRGSAHGSGLGKTRYVVEQTLAWMGHFRRIRSCYEKKPEHFQAFNELAVCAMLAHRLRPNKRCHRY